MPSRFRYVEIRRGALLEGVPSSFTARQFSQMKDFLKDLNEDLEILVKIPSPTQKDGLWEPLDGMNIKVEPQPPGK